MKFVHASVMMAAENAGRVSNAKSLNVCIFQHTFQNNPKPAQDKLCFKYDVQSALKTTTKLMRWCCGHVQVWRWWSTEGSTGSKAWEDPTDRLSKEMTTITPLP